MAGTSPAMTNVSSANLQKPRDAAISADFIARTGEICMISMYSQIASSRPKPVSDARVAL
jgi:hypothetical protein